MTESLIEKLQELKAEYEKLSAEMAAGGSRQERYQTCARRMKELAPIMSRYDELVMVQKRLADAKEILEEQDGGELAELAGEEINTASAQLDAINKELSQILSGQKKQVEGEEMTGVLVEIRAGTGGEEAALFARDLFQIYSRFAEKKGWKIEVIDCHRAEMGGFKEIIFGVGGSDVFRSLRYEGGVHRVQRIPATESSGRIHTSTVTVAVLPEIEEIQVKIDPKDLRVDTYRSSSAGGQHVNVTDSAIRIVHLPTGITVQCQDERSQHKNRAKAMRVLRARLMEHFREKRDTEIAKDRSSQVKTAERSQKIRTYNFPQNRVTDHRIGFTANKLDSVIKGDLNELLSALSEKME